MIVKKHVHVHVHAQNAFMTALKNRLDRQQRAALKIILLFSIT